MSQLLCSCGNDMFEKVSQVRGTWSDILISEESGLKVLESSTDSLIHIEPKTIRCTDCKKRYKNPAA